MEKIKIKGYSILIMLLLFVVIMFINRPENKHIVCYGINSDKLTPKQISELSNLLSMKGKSITIVDMDTNIIWD